MQTRNRELMVIVCLVVAYVCFCCFVPLVQAQIDTLKRPTVSQPAKQEEGQEQKALPEQKPTKVLKRPAISHPAKQVGGQDQQASPEKKPTKVLKRPAISHPAKQVGGQDQQAPPEQKKFKVVKKLPPISQPAQQEEGQDQQAPPEQKKFKVVKKLPPISPPAEQVGGQDQYQKMDFGFNGCNVQFGELKTNVSETDMMRLAAAAGAEGFSYHPMLKYGKIMIGEYPQGCKSRSNLSWPLYLKIRGQEQIASPDASGSKPERIGHIFRYHLLAQKGPIDWLLSEQTARSIQGVGRVKTRPEKNAVDVEFTGPFTGPTGHPTSAKTDVAYKLSSLGIKVTDVEPILREFWDKPGILWQKP